MILVSSDNACIVEYYKALRELGLYVVKVNNSFQFQPYLSWFDRETCEQINSYYHYRDRLTAFISQLLKCYYLPYLINIPPSEIIIGYTQYHKPCVVNPELKEFKFNISHSNKYVIMATTVSSDYNIGVDIELINYDADIAGMSGVVFSESERQLINGSAENFFKLWTKKEALIKACGTGFATDFYQATNINLEDLEIGKDYLICVQKLDDYYLSICLYPNSDFGV